ncbi:MAG: A24 family peptidase [Planctomycetota bacterium]
MPPPVFHAVVATVAGLVVGSFLNVVIWRLPRGESLSHPPSRCPGCGKAIRWWQNVPVVSWVLLRGRCAGCRVRIPFRYPFVELLTGALFLAAWLAWGEHPVTAVLVAVHLAALVAVTFIDADHKIIPDKISKPGLVAALAAAPWMALPDRPKPLVPGASPALDAWLVALAGAAVGAGILLAIRWIASALKKREAMGLGDVKLLAWIGALVGPVYVLVALVVGCVVGSVIGLFIVVVAKLRALPARVRIEVGDVAHEVTSVRIKDGLLVVDGGPAVPADTPARIHLVLDAVRVLEDDDVTIDRPGAVVASEPLGSASRWRVRVDQLTESEDEHLWLFRNSGRYVPFGPFLALGGAACLLVPGWVWWLIVEAYPSLVRRGG